MVGNFKGTMEFINCELEGKCNILKGSERTCIPPGGPRENVVPPWNSLWKSWKRTKMCSLLAMATLGYLRSQGFSFILLLSNNVVVAYC